MKKQKIGIALVAGTLMLGASAVAILNGNNLKPLGIHAIDHNSSHRVIEKTFFMPGKYQKAVGDDICANQPTTYSYGEYAHWYCVDCGKHFEDEGCTTEATNFQFSAFETATKEQVAAGDGIAYTNDAKMRLVDQCTTYGTDGGPAQYVKVDGKVALIMSRSNKKAEDITEYYRADPTDLNDNSSQVRFVVNGLENVSGFSFDYKFVDFGSGVHRGQNVHTFVEAVSNGSVYSELLEADDEQFVNDGAWHKASATLTGSAIGLDYFSVRVNDFRGYMLITNLKYEHEHEYTIAEIDTTKIGTKTLKCECGDVGETVPVTASDIDFSVNKFGDLVNWHPTGSWINSTTWEPASITNEPTWANWGHKATTTKTSIVYSQVQQWCGSRKLELPKIDYSVFTKVSFDMNVDIEPGSTWKTFACSFDTIDNRDNSFVKITDMASKTGKLSVTQMDDSTFVMNIKYGEVNDSLTITDTDVIRGNKPLCFYSFLLGGSATPNITLSNLQLIDNSHVHNFEYVSDSSTVIGETTYVCSTCGTEKVGSLPGSVVDFSKGVYGATIDGVPAEKSNGDGTRGFTNGLRFKSETSAYANRDLVVRLPRINYSLCDSASMEFANNSANLKFGFASDNMIDLYSASGDAHFVLDVSRVGNQLICSLSTNTHNKVISAIITDADVISGKKGLEMYYYCNLYRNLFMSPVTVDGYSTAGRYRASGYANNDFQGNYGVEGATANAWGHFGGNAVYYSGISAGNHKLWLGKTNYAAYEEVSYDAWCNAGVSVGYDENHQIPAVASNNLYFRIVVSLDKAAKNLTVKVLPYGINDEGFENLNEAGIVTYTVDDPEVCFGHKTLELVVKSDGNGKGLAFSRAICR